MLQPTNEGDDTNDDLEWELVPKNGAAESAVDNSKAIVTASVDNPKSVVAATNATDDSKPVVVAVTVTTDAVDTFRPAAIVAAVDNHKPVAVAAAVGNSEPTATAEHKTISNTFSETTSGLIHRLKNHPASPTAKAAPAVSHQAVESYHQPTCWDNMLGNWYGMFDFSDNPAGSKPSAGPIHAADADFVFHL
jgi:hypothetical protein